MRIYLLVHYPICGLSALLGTAAASVCGLCRGIPPVLWHLGQPGARASQDTQKKAKGGFHELKMAKGKARVLFKTELREQGWIVLSP